MAKGKTCPNCGEQKMKKRGGVKEGTSCRGLLERAGICWKGWKRCHMPVLRRSSASHGFQWKAFGPAFTKPSRVAAKE